MTLNPYKMIVCTVWSKAGVGGRRSKGEGPATVPTKRASSPVGRRVVPWLPLHGAINSHSAGLREGASAYSLGQHGLSPARLASLGVSLVCAQGDSAGTGFLRLHDRLQFGLTAPSSSGTWLDTC